MKVKHLFIVCYVFLGVACSGTSRTIIDRPITFDENRMALTREYLQNRYDLQAEGIDITPKMIVLHWTAIPSLQASFEAFDPVQLPGTRQDVQSAGALNVSAHFLVDRDGTIYRLMPETTMARHVIGLNHCAIGIENVGGTEDTPLTAAQLRSNIYLVRYLANTYSIDYLIGHYEYPLFEGHKLWLEKDEGYRTEKTDPGKDFMRKVRRATKKLNFKPLPN